MSVGVSGGRSRPRLFRPSVRVLPISAGVEMAKGKGLIGRCNTINTVPHIREPRADENMKILSRTAI
jgi:hypothetical protein